MRPRAEYSGSGTPSTRTEAESPARSWAPSRVAAASATMPSQPRRSDRFMCPLRSGGTPQPGSGSLGGKPFLQHDFHAGAERVEFGRRRVDARRDPQAVELLMDDRGRHDPVLVPEVGLELLGVDAVHV